MGNLFQNNKYICQITKNRANQEGKFDSINIFFLELILLESVEYQYNYFSIKYNILFLKVKIP